MLYGYRINKNNRDQKRRIKPNKWEKNQAPCNHSFLSFFLPSFLFSFLPFFFPSFLSFFLPSFLFSFLPSFLPSLLPSLLSCFLPHFPCLPFHSLLAFFIFFFWRLSFVLIPNIWCLSPWGASRLLPSNCALNNLPPESNSTCRMGPRTFKRNLQ